MLATRRASYARGFTLIEILVAITLLVIVLGIVYGAYSSVVMSVERTREASERLKTMQFIVRGFAQNLSQATEGWSPGSAYRPYSAAGDGASADGSAADRGEMRFPFSGEIKRGPDGEFDSLTFGSTAPMLGGGQLPGQIKMCTYRLEQEEAGEDEDAEAAEKLSKEERKERDARKLLVLTETPWTVPSGGAENEAFTDTDDAVKRISEAAEETGQRSVTRSVPVYGWDLAYFDGKEWVEEWDAQELGRLPWTVRVRVKLERDPEEEETRELDPEKDDSVIELLFSVPVGEGVHDAPPDYVRPSDREEQV
jgi:prepilin-type N-terminal cleavage/methylation domain-containing protein